MAENDAILAFKNTLNTTVPSISNTGKDPVKTGDVSLIEPSMLISLDNSMETVQKQIKLRGAMLAGSNVALAKSIENLNVDGRITPEFADIVRQLQATNNLEPGFASTIKSAGTIVDSFESLSHVTQATISKAQVAFRPTAFDKVNSAQQGFDAIRTVQQYLDIDDTGTVLSGDKVSVADKTARAMRDKLATLKAQNPDIDVKFDANKFDSNAVAFLQKLQEKQMKSAGVTKDTLNTTLLRLWTEQGLKGSGGTGNSSDDMNKLGEASSLLSAMRYMTTGSLNNGSTAERPSVNKSWDLEWTDKSSGDQFFNTNVYHVLQTYGQVDIGELLQTSPFKFRNENLVEAVQRIRQMAATPEGQKNQDLVDMAKKFEHFEKFGMNSKLTQYQVGMIAVEVMSIQARKLCIDEKDVNKAIESGAYAPNLADLDMVNTGMGYPPGAFESLPPGAIEPAQKKFDVFATAHMGRALLNYRGEQFEQRFGGITDGDAQKAIDTKYARFHHAKLDYLKDSLQSPIMRYNSGAMTGRTQLEAGYIEKREAYLSGLGQRLQDSSCITPSNGLNNGNGTPAASPTLPGGGAAGAGNGNSTCLADQVRQGGCSAKPPEPSSAAATSSNGTENSGSSACLADQVHQGKCSKVFGDAAGSGTTNVSAAIEENIASATGSPSTAPADTVCTADLVRQGNCSISAPGSAVRP